jgi:HSP20 family protein
VKKENISLKVTDDNNLEISAEKKYEKKLEGSTWRRLESGFGSVSRSFPLPKNVDSEQIKAQFLNGVLEITLPKCEEKGKEQQSIKIN